MKKYRVGIVGLGRMGSTIDDEGHTELPYSVAASCQASQRLEVVAGVDLVPEKRQAFSKRWGVGALFEECLDMVEQTKPDLVAVCTAACLPKPANSAPDAGFRGDSHAELTVALAKAGVPMLYVEKAMASSMAAADDARDAVKRSGAQFNTGVLRRFDNRYAAVRQVIEAGRIGQPKVVVHYAASSLMHGHIHSIDTVSYLLGDPPIAAVRGELAADAQTAGRQIAADPRATYQLRFENGIEAWSVPAAGWEFEVLGSEGAVRSLNNGAGIQLRRATDKAYAWQEIALEPVVPVSPVMACLEDLVEAHETGRPTLGHVDLTHHITEACIGVAESHFLGGAWVDLPLENRDLYIFHV
jgi:predicted dehydrogenase